MSGLDDHNYTNLPSGVTPAAPARILSANEVPGSSQQAEKKTKKLSNLSNLALLAGVMIFVGSIAFAIQRTSVGTKAKADTNASSVIARDTVATLLNRDLILTKTITSYPKTYKGKQIDPKLIEQGEEFYKDKPQNLKKEFVINRLILYYTLQDALNENKISTKVNDTDFDTINLGINTLRASVRDTLLTQAEYLYIKADFSKNRGYQGQAAEVITQYHDRLVADPNNYRKILADANADKFLRDINHGEMNDFVYNYVDDDNNVSEQTNFIFDQSFDDILFKLPPNKVSNVIILNSQIPYAYVVVYPTKITIKAYQSTAEIVSKKLPLFTF